MVQPIVKRLNQVVIRTASAVPLFNLLKDDLELPLAWQVKSNPFYFSGGLNLGNTYLEIIQVKNSSRNWKPLSPKSGTAPAWLYGLAFQLHPYAVSLPELSLRGIPHTLPMPFMEMDKHEWLVTTWNTVYLGGLLEQPPLARAFFRLANRAPQNAIEHSSWPNWFTTRIGYPSLFDRIYRNGMIYSVEYNSAWFEALTPANPGSPGLELVGLREVQIGARNLKEARENWWRLLFPANEIQPMLWELEDGTYLRLVDHPEDRLVSMVWQVRSLNRAAQYLHHRGMLGSESREQVTIAPDKIMGLDIRLVV